jgi:hypothetical protein
MPGSTEPGICILPGVDALSCHQQEPATMSIAAEIKDHAEIIGADGVHVGTVDKVEGDRIKLIKTDSGEGHHRGDHHFIPLGLVAEVENGTVRLSANADVAVTFEEEASGASVEQ